MEMHCSSKNISNLEFLKQFIWTQKTKISKFVIPILNTVYIDKLPDIIDQYNSTNHTMGMTKRKDARLEKYTKYILIMS